MVLIAPVPGHYLPFTFYQDDGVSAINFTTCRVISMRVDPGFNLIKNKGLF